MKILVLTQHWYPDTFGGSEHVASEQARRLAQRGHEVTVITERMKEGLPYYQEEGRLRIFRYGSPAELTRLGGQTRTALREVPKALRSILQYSEVRPPDPRRSDLQTFDVAILHHPFVAYGFFKAKLDIPALYLFHASAAKEMELEGLQRTLPIWAEPARPLLASFFIRIASRLERQVFQKATALGVFSEFSKQLLYSLAPLAKARTRVLSVGIDQKIFQPWEPDQARARLGLAPADGLLLTVRRFSPRMGIAELISAMELVRAEIPPARLLIVGEGSLRGAYQKEIARRNLQNAVTLVGTVPLTDLPLYYQAADAFVLPTEAFEGLGMATLEALSCGVPVIGTPVGATPEILRKLDLSLLTGGTEAAALSRGIIEFLKRPAAEKIRLRVQARAVAERDYKWDPAIEELEGLLNKLRIRNVE